MSKGMLLAISPGPSRTDEIRGLVLGTVAVAVWSVTLPATRAAVAALEPVFVGLGRGVVAGCLAALYLALARQRRPTLREIGSLVILVGGLLVVALAMTFLVTSSRGMRDLAGGAGLLGPLERFGGRITVDTCILATPMLPKSVKRLMTSSAKYAYYSPGLLGTEVVFGSMVDCVESAVRGTVVRDDSLWEVKT